jgi:zinc-binding alcohol dehydrogenase/oxidoreductase
VRAVRLHEGGELREEQVSDPVPGPDEILVELRAASVNRRDVLVRNPPSPAYEFELPLVPGSDGAGVVRGSGEEVVVYPLLGWGGGEVPEPGWALLGGPADGTYAELVKVPRANVFPKPDGFSWEEAAALGVAGLTAYRALFGAGGLREGETVLVLGAGSGVSTLAVQLAREAGARVLVTSSSRAKLERATELGAEGGALYTEEGWAGELGRVDLIFDSVGSGWEGLLGILRDGGRLVSLGATAGSRVDLDPRALYLRWLSIRGSTLGSPADFADMLELAAGGGLRPVLDSVWPLGEAAAAQERMLAGEHFGKLVLRPGG